MTFSSLTTETAPHKDKFSSRRGARVERMIIHHWAASGWGGYNTLVNSGTSVSANYMIYSDGTICGQVPEEYRAWTTGSPDWDNQSITVEIQNESVGGQWRISDAAMRAFINLFADVANRYGFGSLYPEKHLRAHREFVSTVCPGDYIMSRRAWICQQAQAARSGNTPAPAAPLTDDIGELATAVMRGDYGNGEERRARLGGKYDAVQAEINRRLYGGSGGGDAGGYDITALAEAVIRGDYGNGEERRARLGGKYDEVQAEVNRRLYGGGDTSGGGAGGGHDDIGDLAAAVIRGDYGNGEERRARLGGKYDAVQTRVNEILGIS